MDTQPSRAAAYHAGVDESLHRRVVESHADFIVDVAADGRILYASPSTCALLGRVAAGLRGEPLQHHQHVDDSPRTEEALRALASPPHRIVLGHRAHLFEPFWTTKEQGSGPGLASVFGTVKAHHGAIDVSARLGAGTVLPSVQASEEQRGGGPARAAAVPGVRVLVVDDERVVRGALQRILERDGHQVSLAECGQEALDLFARSWKEIDVVILDVMMPDVDGREVLRRMRETNPAVRTILSSGFTAESDPSLTVAGAWLLQKPYTPEQVRAALAEAMAGAK